jgi:competence protein ComEC
VIAASVGSMRALLTGDLEATGEGELLARDSPSLRSDVLKVGHHGSRSSTSALFIDAVRPRLAVVSSGRDNPYGHPSPAVIERLAKRGVRTLSTQSCGAVRIRFAESNRLRVWCGGLPE